jgi:CheY-like chemotaxis protein
VLFVDDERFIRQLMRELLRDVGLRAETAADGYEALKKFRSATGISCSPIKPCLA